MYHYSHTIWRNKVTKWKCTSYSVTVVSVMSLTAALQLSTKDSFLCCPQKKTYFHKLTSCVMKTTFLNKVGMCTYFNIPYCSAILIILCTWYHKNHFRNSTSYPWWNTYVGILMQCKLKWNHSERFSSHLISLTEIYSSLSCDWLTG